MLPFALTALLAPPAPIVVHVSDNGNDRWTGRLAEPAEGDGPVRTFEGAKARVRRVKDGKRTVEVRFSSGTHRIERPLTLGPEDSGTADAPVVFTSYGKERRGFSGLRVIVEHGKRNSLKAGTDGLWRITLPEVAAGKWWFDQLYVNGTRRQRARSPKEGYYAVAERVPPTAAAHGKGFDRFQYGSGDLRADWRNQDDVLVTVFHNWSVSHNRVAQVDEASSTVTFKTPTGFDSDWAAFRKGDRYLVESREGLDEPGEWWLDRQSGELAYFPLPQEKPDTVWIEAPVVERLLELKGDPANGKWVEHVQFKQLSFWGSGYPFPEKGRFFPQAEADLSGALALTGVRDASFDNCEVLHTGTYGLEIGAACQRVTVKGCKFEDLGGGGVKVGEMPYQREPALLTSHNRLEECLIRGGGRIHPAAVGVWIGSSPHNTVRGNWIEDFYYTGVSVGWSWGYGESAAHHNLIEGNTIAKIGQGVLSDMGGVYLLGVSPGTVVRGNRVFDVRSHGYGGWGLYTDEGSTGIVLEDNVVFRCKSASFHQHYGKENVIRNNVFAFAGEHQLMRTRPEPHLSFTLERNIVVWDKGDLLGSNWQEGQFRLDNNLYWKVGGGAFDFAGRSLADWRATGQDLGSVVADPGFVNSAGGDFRLKPDSPAFALGFRAFPAMRPSPRPTGRYASLPKAWP